jgi:uncharacterized membrane protein YhaH (DUF805 family)
MTFQDSISTCFKKYVDFSGRATRSEFWWFVLFIFVISCILNIISYSIAAIFSLAILLPYIAVGVRRLHDTNRSGWWLLIGFIPLIGAIVLIVFFAQEGTAAPTPAATA